MIGSITSAFIVLAISLLIWALLDVAYSLYKNPATKTPWVWLILFFPVGGPLYYFRVVKKSEEENREFNSNFGRTRVWTE